MRKLIIQSRIKTPKEYLCICNVQRDVGYSLCWRMGRNNIVLLAEWQARWKETIYEFHSAEDPLFSKGAIHSCVRKQRTV